MEASTPTSPEATPPKAQPMSAPVTDASAGTVPEYPKDLYDEAHIENEHRDFNQRIMEARAPREKEVIPPAVAPGIAAQTLAEMEAGRARVAHFEEIEANRKTIAARVPEKWEGKSTPVFRPGDVSEYKTTLKGPAQTVSKDNVRQPTPR